MIHRFVYRILFGALIVITILLPIRSAPAQPLAPTMSVVTWNVESGGSAIDTIVQRIAEMDGIDLWGLTEVRHAGDGEAYVAAAQVGEDAEFEGILGTTGGEDRLLVIYDAGRFTYGSHEELSTGNVGGDFRGSLVVQLRDRETGVEFLFMVNQLHATDSIARYTQAAELNVWAAKQELPVIAVGDYAFNWDVRTQAHDLGYSLMTMQEKWKWVRPSVLVTTQCSGWPCAIEHVLDFVFVAGSAKGWPAQSGIIVVEDDFPDDGATSDHRPVHALFTFEDAIAPGQSAPRALYLPVVEGEIDGSANSTPTATKTATALPTGTPTATPIVTATATVPATGGVCSCAGDIHSCSDFATQSSAQACWLYCFGQGVGDIHRLDEDVDGVACESLPFQVIQ